MTTSGSIDYNPSRSVIVNGALRLVNAYSSGMVPTPEQLSNAYEALNLLLKSWQTVEGLWLKQFVEIVLVKGQVTYSLPGAAGGVGLIKTTSTADTAISATSIDLASVSSITVGDKIYIPLDDDTLHTSTITDISSLTVSFVEPTVAAGTSGDPVFTVPSNNVLTRPTRIFTQSRSGVDSIDTPIDSISREDYSTLPIKTAEGKVSQIYYDPQLSTGVVYTWPTPDTTGERLLLTVDRIIQDIDSSSDTFDVPQEWLECLKYRLATRLAPEYSIPTTERQMLLMEYTALVTALKVREIEHVSTYFSMDRSA